jgi:hypothetical protein|tara:strand:- start:534 stop:824 length:291 start_codon:yes stop_codon:yes gene_type:complete
MIGNIMNEADLILEINEYIPEARAVSTKEFYDNEDSKGIWFKGSEDIASDGTIVFDCNESYRSDTQGIHPTLYDILEKAGWYGQPYDAGTLLAYEI